MRSIYFLYFSVYVGERDNENGEKTIDVRQQEKLVSAEKSTLSEQYYTCDPMLR